MKELREFNSRLRVLQVLQFIDAVYPIYVDLTKTAIKRDDWTAVRGYRLNITQSPQTFLLEKGFPWELKIAFGSFNSSSFTDQDQVSVSQWLPGDSDTKFPEWKMVLFDKIQLGTARADLYLTPPRSLVPLCPIMAEYSGAITKQVYLAIHYAVPQPPKTGIPVFEPEAFKTFPLVKGKPLER